MHNKEQARIRSKEFHLKGFRARSMYLILLVWRITNLLVISFALQQIRNRTVFIKSWLCEITGCTHFAHVNMDVHWLDWLETTCTDCCPFVLTFVRFFSARCDIWLRSIRFLLSFPMLWCILFVYLRWLLSHASFLSVSSFFSPLVHVSLSFGWSRLSLDLSHTHTHTNKFYFIFILIMLYGEALKPGKKVNCNDDIDDAANRMKKAAMWRSSQKSTKPSS